MSEKKKFERLPTSVKPTTYDLFLNPDLKSFTFDGKEVIYLQIVQPTNQIILNSVDLKINSAQLKLVSSAEVLTAQCTISIAEETLTLSFPKTLPTGEAELIIEFVGQLDDLMKGFYRGKYTTIDNQEEKYYAVTQFAATDARRCFPCWDEPAIKARFDITVAVNRDKIALSNMPIASERINEDGLKVIKFQTSPIMSTYLVALVVGDFDYVEDKSSDDVLVRVYTPPGKKEQGKFALYVATKVLPYYNEYFQIAYPLPKIDLIAISELAYGAMENWGLVTYRETRLLVDPANTSAATKQTVAIIIGHELAHQWFGNLVTMEWWTDLWLNEGYASFVEFLCVAYLFPEFDIWTQFVTDLYCRALELDALKNSHPIEVLVGHPSEVDEIFDDITYAKGGSVLRMLHKYIGDDDFRKGMNLYLTRHQYGNTHTQDLWAALEETSSKPVQAVISTWTKQKGFPLITIESSLQEASIRTFVLSQTNFCAEATEKDNETLWLIPLSFSKQSNPTEECFSTILEGRRCEISIPNVDPNEWVKLNPGTFGFYRTRYPVEILKSMIPSISDKSLPPLDRLGILDDSFALVTTGKINTIQVLDLMSAMTDEDNYTVWADMATCLEAIYNLLSNTDYDFLYNAYGLKLLTPIYIKLGVNPKPNESHLITLLRSLILNQLIKFGHTDFLSIARSKFVQHYNSSEIIDADLRGVMYKAVIAAEGKTAFDALLELYKKTDLQEEKERILRSFSAITDPSLVDQILKFAQSDNVTPASAVTTLISVASSKIARERTWQYLKENWQHLNEKFSAGFLRQRLIKSITENYATEEKAKEIEEFFASKDISGVERVISQCVETIRNNAAWLNRDGDSIKTYLKKLQ